MCRVKAFQEGRENVLATREQRINIGIRINIDINGDKAGEVKYLLQAQDKCSSRLRLGVPRVDGVR